MYVKISRNCFPGVFAFLQSVLVVDLLGTEHLSVAFGILLLVQGTCVLIGPPIAGKTLYSVVR